MRSIPSTRALWSKISGRLPVSKRILLPRHEIRQEKPQSFQRFFPRTVLSTRMVNWKCISFSPLAFRAATACSLQKKKRKLRPIPHQMGNKRIQTLARDFLFFTLLTRLNIQNWGTWMRVQIGQIEQISLPLEKPNPRKPDWIGPHGTVRGKNSAQFL